MTISIIIPIFNEEGNIRELHSRLALVAKGHDNKNFCFIFIDDCSTDKTSEILEEIFISDKRVNLIRFARNSGSHAAIAAGLNSVQTDAAIIMAADLQDPPELINALLLKWKEGYQTVWGVRSARTSESVFIKTCSKIYYFLMNWLTTISLPPTGADVVLVDKKVVQAFKQVREKHTSIFMTLTWLGFKQTSVTYAKEARASGQSKWTFAKKFKLALDSILAFSDIPIRYMSVLGILVASLGFIFAIGMFLGYLGGLPLTGWSALMVVVLILGGIQMSMLGILGEYLWRTFDESRGRPRYIIEYEKTHSKGTLE